RDVPARAHAERHTAELLPRGERGAARYRALGHEVELGESHACHPFELERGSASSEALRAGDAEVSVAQVGVVMDLLRTLKIVPGQRNELVAAQRLIAASGTARVFELDAPIERSRCGCEPLRIPGQTDRGNHGVGVPDLDGFLDWTRGQVPACSQAARRYQDRRGRIDRK